MPRPGIERGPSVSLTLSQLSYRGLQGLRSMSNSSRLFSRIVSASAHRTRFRAAPYTQPIELLDLQQAAKPLDHGCLCRRSGQLSKIDECWATFLKGNWEGVWGDDWLFGLVA